MSKSKKIDIAIYVIAGILIASVLLSMFISLGRNKKINKTDNVVITNTELNIVDYNIEFQQNASSINLLSSEIKTNVEIDNVFINVSRVGCQDLSYTQEVTDDGFYLININPSSCILGACFDSDTKLTADIYVEYANRSFKVVSRDIDVRDCWTPAY